MGALPWGSHVECLSSQRGEGDYNKRLQWPIPNGRSQSNDVYKGTSYHSVTTGDHRNRYYRYNSQGGYKRSRRFQRRIGNPFKWTNWGKQTMINLQGCGWRQVWTISKGVGGYSLSMVNTSTIHPHTMVNNNDNWKQHNIIMRVFRNWSILFILVQV